MFFAIGVGVGFAMGEFSKMAGGRKISLYNSDPKIPQGFQKYRYITANEKFTGEIYLRNKI